MSNPLQYIHPRNLKYFSESLDSLVRTHLWAKVILGLVLGILVGIFLGPTTGMVDATTAKIIGSWLVLPGNIFLALIQMIVVPLILASVVRGIASSPSTKQLKKMGLRLVIYFLCTTTVAVILGLGLTAWLKPGTFIDIETAPSENLAVGIDQTKSSNIISDIPDGVVSILPENPLNSAVEMDMLGIVIFSLIFGLALVSIDPKQSKPLLDLLGSLQSVVMRVVKWVMKLAPLAVFGFIAQVTLQTGLDSMTGLGMYIGVLLLALSLMLMLYAGIAFFVGGIRPWTFFAKLREVQLLAFSTNSSVTVMPVSIKTAEESFHVRPSVSQFVIPIGATVNMDGTAVFQGVATLFLTQAYGMDLGLGALVALVFTVIGASIGTPATPGVGIIMLSAVLTGAGIPLEGIALIIGVDRVLELFRTVTNVSGDITASIVMNTLSPAQESYDQEIAREQMSEAIRKKTGEDVITGEVNVPEEHGLFYRVFHPFGD